jgi:hypothetical protein
MGDLDAPNKDLLTNSILRLLHRLCLSPKRLHFSSRVRHRCGSILSKMVESLLNVHQSCVTLRCLLAP